MDPLHLTIALLPVATYFLVMGLINRTSRPFLTNGLRDALALAIAVSGFAMVGPLKLFIPETAISRFGVYVWFMLLALYCLGASLVALLIRPRLIFYNVTSRELRPYLASVVERIDNQARWAGDSLLLPGLGVHLHLEEFSPMRGVQLVATGTRQDLTGWRELELQLRRSLNELTTSKNTHGLGLILISLCITLVLAFSLITFRTGVPQALREFLYLR
jgi:hypothetical protein